jgi:hypothetical protein
MPCLPSDDYDYINSLGENINAMNKSHDTLLDENREAGLQVNTGNLVFMSHRQSKGEVKSCA